MSYEIRLTEKEDKVDIRLVSSEEGYKLAYCFPDRGIFATSKPIPPQALLILSSLLHQPEPPTAFGREFTLKEGLV